MAEAGRFQLLNTPVAHPGVCAISGSTGPVIDTGYVQEWFPANAPRPRLYLSVDTVREMAEVAGVRATKSLNEQVNETAVYNRGYMDAVKERVGDQLVELVDRLGLLAALLGADDDVPAEGDADALEGEAEAGLDDAGSAEPDDDQPGQGGRTRRQQRRADVSGNPAA